MFSVDKGLEFIAESGDASNKILVKTDQENAIEYFVKELVEARSEGKTIVEESPVKSSQSNGLTERAVQEIGGRVRCLWIGLQMRLGRSLDARERIVAFIPEYASYILNHLQVGGDGKVPYERVRGKRHQITGLEFGEKVLFRHKEGNKLPKLESRWEKGIFVGSEGEVRKLWCQL